MRAAELHFFLTFPLGASFFSWHMIEISLGQRLQERDKADLSLRNLSRKVGISAPFLSELGRRFPSEEILAKLASALNVSLEDLKKYDTASRLCPTSNATILSQSEKYLRVVAIRIASP
jgi:transcriptional regulator with XRE-family HTH domain